MYRENYQLLADAIVLQAVMDYRRAKKKLKKNKKNQYAKSDIKEVRMFLSSEWFFDLTGADGEVILTRLEKGEAPGRRMIGTYNW